MPAGRMPGPAARVKTEEDPLDPNPPAAFRETLRAIQYLESAVLQASGIEGLVLRYGGFYGPGNAIGENGSVVEQVRHRRVPVIGGGTGVWSFIHIDDAARATRSRGGARSAGHLQHSGRRTRAGSRLAPHARPHSWRKATVTIAGLARPPGHRRAWSGHDDGNTRGLECESEARAGLATTVGKLARWVPDRALELRRRRVRLTAAGDGILKCDGNTRRYVPAVSVISQACG